jgi:HPt (histidine-containing phosphotransfer) domain-containing protein
MNGIDRTYLSTIFTERDELEEVIAEGIADICSQLGMLNLAFGQNDRASVREIAHRIKGVAANLGATQIQRAASDLETAVATHVSPQPDLVTALSRAVDALAD